MRRAFVSYSQPIISFSSPDAAHAPRQSENKMCFFEAAPRIATSRPLVQHREFTTKFSPIVIGLNWSSDAIVFIREETLSAHSPRPRKIPGWRNRKCSSFGLLRNVIIHLHQNFPPKRTNVAMTTFSHSTPMADSVQWLNQSDYNICISNLYNSTNF